MKPIDQQNFFELLDLPPSATAADVERAYERARAFYGPDSMATYSLIDAGEARSLVERIEEAYLTLSDAELRRSYEASLGLAALDGGAAPPAPEATAPAPAAPPEATAESPRGEESMEPPSALPAAMAAQAPVALELAAPAIEDAPPAPKPEEPPAPAPSAPSASSALPTFPWPGSRPVEEEHDFAARAIPAAAAPPSPVPAAEAPPFESSQASASVGAPPAVVERAPAPEALAAPPESSQASTAAAGAPAPVVERAPAPEALAAPESSQAPTAAAGAPPPAVERAPAPEALAASPESVPRALAAPAVLAARIEERPAEEPRPPSPARPATKPFDIGPNPVFSGELLRRVRESRGLSLRDLSEKTRVGLSHLENVEADRYDALPVAVYLRGFLMLVARELKLDPLKVAKGYMELAVKAKASKS